MFSSEGIIRKIWIFEFENGTRGLKTVKGGGVVKRIGEIGLKLLYCRGLKLVRKSFACQCLRLGVVTARWNKH